MAFVSIGGLVATAAFAHAMNREDQIEETTDERPIQANDFRAGI
jgi:hypothetical protein